MSLSMLDIVLGERENRYVFDFLQSPDSGREGIIMSNLIGKQEVAKMLGCSVRQVDNLRKKRGLPFLLLESAVRFRPEDIERWIAERMQNAVKQ